MSVGECYFKDKCAMRRGVVLGVFRVVFQRGDDQAVLSAAKMLARQGGRVTGARRRGNELRPGKRRKTNIHKRRRGRSRNVGTRGRPNAMLLRSMPGLCRVRLLVETDSLHCSMFQDAHLSSKPLARVRQSSRPLQPLVTPIDPLQ
jgi:hypothetical protein